MPEPAKPTIQDPPAPSVVPPVAPPVVPPVEPPAPIAVPNPDLAELSKVIKEMQAQGSSGLMAMFQKAQELSGKMDRLVGFIEANPAASFKDAIAELKKDLPKPTVPGVPEVPDSLSARIADWIMPGMGKIGK